MSTPKIIVITGPTATGKTALGISVAKSVDCEVVSADSMQVYKHMDIGTSKPLPDETLDIPHHMIDFISPLDDYSVARYVKDATICVDDIFARNKTPLLVGGSGLYIDSLLSGQGFKPRGNDDIRQELESRYDSLGGETLLQELRTFDPSSADRLNANDKKRIVRAIEVFKTTGKTISEHNDESAITPPKYNAIKFALTFSDRDLLYARIDKRVEIMVSDGLEREVQNLLDMGVSKGSTAMQAIGYKEMVDALLGNCSVNEAVEKIKMESRRYAKRQLTWLRRDKNINWITWDKSPDYSMGVDIILKHIYTDGPSATVHNLPEK